MKNTFIHINRKLLYSLLSFTVAFSLILSAVSCVLLIAKADSLEAWDGTAASSFAGGTGTEDDPYLIENGGQLYKMVSEYSGVDVTSKKAAHTYFEITKDIDLNNKQWFRFTNNATTGTPSLGSVYNATVGFNGIIEGNGHTIYNLYRVDSNGTRATGLIPMATQGAEIHNLNLENGTISGNHSGNGYAALIGGAKGSGTSVPIVIENCSVTGFTVTSTSTAKDNSFAGGFVGYATSQSIEIRNSYIKDSTITSAGAKVGAFISYAGGNAFENAIVIENSYCIGTAPIGTLTTDFASVTAYTNVYTDVEGFDGTTGVKTLTTEQMKGENAKTNMSGFDFNNIWQVNKDDYPTFAKTETEEKPDGWDGTVAESFAGGTGTEADPYLIENGGQLYKMVSEYSNVDVTSRTAAHTYFEITKDINLNNKQWFRFTNNDSTGTPSLSAVTNATVGFNGIIEGNGHTVYNLSRVDDSGTRATGLIPMATQGAEIHNLNLENGTISSSHSSNGYAALIGGAKGANASVPIIIENCSVTGFSVSTSNAAGFAGGFVGYAVSQSIEIKNSYISNSTITSGTNNPAGAFICYAGGNAYMNSIIIENSYCIGTAPIGNMTGDFAAVTTYTNVYTDVAGFDGTTGIKTLTTEQMQGENAKANMIGFDFRSTWQINAGDYPTLAPIVPYFWNGEVSIDMEDGKAGFAGGSGTAADPYLIENGSQLYRMVINYSTAATTNGASNTAKYFKIIDDIYLNDVKDCGIDDIDASNLLNWNIASVSGGFNHVVDGGGHTVYGLYSKGGKYAGLFPTLTDGAQISNLNVKNGKVSGQYASAIASRVSGYYLLGPVSIKYCGVDSVEVTSTDVAGGIVGYWDNLKYNISDCYVVRSEIKVTTNSKAYQAGGIVGYGYGNKDEGITNCFTDGMHPISATESQADWEKRTVNSSGANLFAVENSYTSAAKNFDLSGLKYVEDNALKGNTAKTSLKGFDFENNWSVVEGDYPVLLATAGQGDYDNKAPGEVWSGKIARTYASGEGTESDPYIIETGGQLALLANDALNGKTAGKYYELACDIILNDTSAKNWRTNANSWYTGGWGQCFKGHLNGNYHIVSGLYINKMSVTKTTYAGLFASIGLDAVVEKVGIVNSSLYLQSNSAEADTGSIAGFIDAFATDTDPSHYPRISECFADTSVDVQGKTCGGFIGSAIRPVKIENCFFTGLSTSSGGITGRGIFGYSKTTTTVDTGVLIKNCYVAASERGFISNANFDTMTYENCYSSSAQDTAGVTRVFVDRMCGEKAKTYMPSLDYDNIWVIRGDSETPGLRGFDINSYNNKMSPKDITVNFITNCELEVPSVTGKAYSKLELPVLKRDGYRFDGWYAYSQLDLPFEYDYFPTFDTQLYAKWTLLGIEQDFEDYPDTEYDLGEDYVYYRPTVADYSAKYVHNGAKSLHRIGDISEESDFLISYENELEIGKKYVLTFWATTDKDGTDTTVSLVHLNWPDIYVENSGVEKVAELKNLSDGEWKQYSYTFVAREKWVALRTTGNSSIYFDDILIYDTGAEKVEITPLSKPDNTTTNSPDSNTSVEETVTPDTENSDTDNESKDDEKASVKKDKVTAENEFPWMIIIIVGIVVLVLIAATVIIIVLKRRSKK